MRRVAETLKPVARQCVLISHDLAAVHHIRQTTSYRIGWILAEYTNLSALKCEALAPDYVFCDHQLLTQSASKLWRGPWRWVVYDVRTPKAALEVATRGAHLEIERAGPHGRRRDLGDAQVARLHQAVDDDRAHRASSGSRSEAGILHRHGPRARRPAARRR